MQSTARLRGSVTGRGFTLIELLLALALIGVLSSIAYPAYTRYVQKARVTAAVADLGKIVLAVEPYRLNNGGNPRLTVADVGRSGMRDPWGNSYEYLNFSTIHGSGAKRKDHNLVPINSEYDLYSKGADGRTQPPLTARTSLDDVIVANDGGFIGLAKDY